MTKIDKKTLWKILRKTKNIFLTEQSEFTCYHGLLSDESIKYIMMSFVEKVGLNTTSSLNEGIPEETLQTATDMFTYLNLCPPKLLSFYASNLFKNGDPKLIVTALTSVLKTSQDTATVKNILSRYPFTALMQSFNLVQYENIQMITNTRKAFIDTDKKYASKEVMKSFGNLLKKMLFTDKILQDQRGFTD